MDTPSLCRGLTNCSNTSDIYLRVDFGKSIRAEYTNDRLPIQFWSLQPIRAKKADIEF